jgi:nucleotide sugar dehydrogenase
MSNKNLFFMDFAKIQNEIRNNTISVCVIGIGRIGLPTALSFAKSGLKTIGVDINEDLVNKINRKEFPLKDEPGYESIFYEVINNGNFLATTKIEEGVLNSDVILLSLPTPMDVQNVPDYSALRIVGTQLKDLMIPGTVLIVESTIEPGFIENDLIKIVESSTKQAGKDFGLGVCPETANPGEIMRDFENLPRLVGATDEKTTNIIMGIYNHVFPVELIKMPNCKTANAVKLTTNVFRDINIAFVNELALLFEKLGIDIFTVLDAADKKYNFQIHYPGAGVGGPCLPVNSYQMLNSAKGVQEDLLKIVKAAREINEFMPLHVIELVKDAYKEAKKELQSSKILILGISYKPNIKDIQLSPAEIVISNLKKSGVNVKIFDPYFKSTNVYGIQTEDNLDKAMSEIDAVIIITAHKEFLDLEPEYFAMKVPILIDTRGLINNHAAKKAGLIFRGLGRGKA